LDDESINVGEFEILYQNKDNRKAGTIIDIYRSCFDIATSDKIIRFRQLQFTNKKMLNIVDILNGKDIDKYIGNKLG
ncbi:methionyl-tRNA formyltransferase, partial [Francisella tularensis subsp. holarctica]|nr:methionyl-tRNA formyltransferase [Francisella tularensis subsp. holarctica]